ncbi:putative secreted protein [Corynebacterium aurimucosum ATCC 700975]|uniref:Putative secreted protein n=2 Tax=Corynebacteriaceae TaxID=1653 RepID=C3PER3_CORA7|nr:putative secreted protein [Corynebacterium aurimucosum ATCC 700975]
MGMKNLRALLSLSLLLPLAACSAGEEDSAAPSAVTTTVVHSANAPAGDDAADDVASGAAPGASGTAPAPASSTIPPLPEGACATSQLSAEIANEQGAAGSLLVDIVLTNTSGEECTLTGFPGVSAVTGNDGTQLGPAALRETSTEAATVTLAPGAQARAGLKITNVGLLDAAACQPQDADGLRIYPPENTDSLYVAVPGLQGCAGEVDILSVQPITELSP